MYANTGGLLANISYQLTGHPLHIPGYTHEDHMILLMLNVGMVFDLSVTFSAQANHGPLCISNPIFRIYSVFMHAIQGISVFLSLAKPVKRDIQPHPIILSVL